ncbi:unnamed protein product [Ambrosiozyma monospora]|uniref:Unnamed protein product n=1 Tax=Ambrosiozyma monospora TaxID=43982 RepID=A0A9W6YLY6_AMBMO|nr:unnamed protein product [Ambrosiozyma monospora]
MLSMQPFTIYVLSQNEYCLRIFIRFAILKYGLVSLKYRLVPLKYRLVVSETNPGIESPSHHLAKPDQTSSTTTNDIQCKFGNWTGGIPYKFLLTTFKTMGIRLLEVYLLQMPA